MLDHILSITAILCIAGQWFRANAICRMELVDWLGRHTRRHRLWRSNRNLFSARGMARRLRFPSAPAAAAWSHFIFRFGIYQHSFWSYRPRFGAGSGNCGGLDDRERCYDADLLFSHCLASEHRLAFDAAVGAWRPRFRILFPLPVLSAAAGILMLLMNWRTQ